MSHTSKEFPIVFREKGQARRIVDIASSLAQILTSKDALAQVSRRPLLVTSVGPATITVDAYEKNIVGAIVPTDRPDTLIVESHAAVADDWMVNFYKDQWCGTASIAHENDQAVPDREAVQGSLYYNLGGAWFVGQSVEISYLGVFGDPEDALDDPRTDVYSVSLLRGFIERNHNFEHPGLVEAANMVLQAV